MFVPKSVWISVETAIFVHSDYKSGLKWSYKLDFESNVDW